jgi:aspartyl-tRNA(Asn)/glutamyl-tRNA(Gln) amidotransferase subunit C
VTISLQEVAKIGKLARIRLDESESLRMQTQLDGIFNWIGQLSEIDVSAVNLQDLPQAQMHERDDVVTTPNQVKEVTQNAPQTAHEMYAVPKVVE